MALHSTSGKKDAKSKPQGRSRLSRLIQSSVLTPLEEKVLAQIKPPKSIMPHVLRVIALIEAAAKKAKVKCRVVCGGSVAKDTYLAHDYDCDIFVRFDPKKFNTDLLFEPLSKIIALIPEWKAELVHGSRDYYQIRIDDVSYELVPTLDIKKPADSQNVTDMSAIHVDWVLSKFADNEGFALNDHIRLAKAFCKAARCYGAESYIGGFSGHVIDILIIHYGGFGPLLKASTSWKHKEIIDIENHLQGEDALMVLNEAKTTSPIIVVDPVLPSRNAAAAITAQSFNRFCAAAEAYLKSPSFSFFQKREITARNFTDKSGVTFVVECTPLSDKKDIAGAQVVKVLEYVCSHAKDVDFDVVASDYSWTFGKACQLFIRVKCEELSPNVVKVGPPTNMVAAGEAFSKEHKDVFVKGNRMFANEKRAFTTFDVFVKSLFDNELISTRVTKLNIRKVI